MATATRSKPFTCSFVAMTIEISDVRYACDPIDPGESGTRAFRLTKHGKDRDVYDVLRRHDGTVACDCPDFEFRHEGLTDAPCKHGRALVELGLMPAPLAPESAPAVEVIEPAPPAPCCTPEEPAPCLACTPAEPAPVAEPAPDPDAFPPDQVDPGDVESPPELWPDECDDHVWNLGPDPADEPAPPTLSLAELVDRQADAYRAWPLDAGQMIARALDELALRVRLTDASTPAEFAARVEVLDRDIREQWEAIGFEQGKASCPCHDGAGSAWGHMA
jgi:hypothetical protein